MKSTAHFLFLAVMSCFAANASAQLIAYESFLGAPLGRGITGSGSDAFGWSGQWTGEGTSDSHFQIVDPAPDLAYQITGGALISGGQHTLLLTTNPEPLSSNLLTTRSFPAINTTFYVSFLLRMPVSGTGSDSIEFHLYSGSSRDIGFAIRPENPGPPAGYLWRTPSDRVQALSGDNSKPHLVVIEAKLLGTGGSHLVNAYVDPGFTYPGSLGGVSGNDPTPYDRIGLAIRSTDTGGPTTTVLIDEIRIGYTWADVVLPAPAPSLIPDLAVAPAVKLRWQTQTGKSYQVQYSYDMSNWFNFGAAIAGNNQIKEVFDSASDGKKYYRVQVP